MPVLNNRQQQIIQTAQALFAEKGYEHATTHQIAKHAGVSEALIFKYHGTKEKLLEHIIRQGYSRIIADSRGRLQTADALELIHAIIDLPYSMVQHEPDFWKLQSRIIDVIPSARMQHNHFMQPVHGLLTRAFNDLGYPSPEKETSFLLLLIEMLWKSLSTDHFEEAGNLREFIKTKYRRQSSSLG